MREIIFKRADMRELSKNARDSREMRETWQVYCRLTPFCLSACVSMCANVEKSQYCIVCVLLHVRMYS